MKIFNFKNTGIAWKEINNSLNNSGLKNLFTTYLLHFHNFFRCNFIEIGFES